MKKKPAMLLTLSAMAVLGLASCGGPTTSEPGSSIKPDVIDSMSTVITKKGLTIDDASGSASVKVFTASADGLYEAGTAIAFEVKAKEFSDITGVYFQGVLLSEEPGSFSVTMPNVDATIKVTTRVYGEEGLLDPSEVDETVIPKLAADKKGDYESVKAAYAKLTAALEKSADVEKTFLGTFQVSGEDTPVIKGAMNLGSSIGETSWKGTFGANNQVFLEGRDDDGNFLYKQRGYDSFGHYYEESQAVVKPSIAKSMVDLNGNYSAGRHTIVAKNVIADTTAEGEPATAAAGEILQKDAEKAIHSTGIGQALIDNYFTAGQTYNFVDEQKTVEGDTEIVSYKAKVVALDSVLAEDKKSFTTTLQAVVPAVLVKRYTLVCTFDGDGLLTHVEQKVETTNQKFLNEEDMTFAEDATFTTINSFSMDAARAYKKDIAFNDLSKYAMTDYSVNFATERITDGNTTVQLENNEAYAFGRIESIKYESNKLEMGGAAIINPVCLGFKEGFEDMGEFDAKNQYVTLKETGKVVLLFDNLFGQTKEVELDVKTPKVFKVTGSISSNKAYTETPITVRAIGTPKQADNLELGLDLGDNKTQATFVKEAEKDENGNTLFTITPKAEGKLDGFVFAVGNPDVKYKFHAEVLGKPDYDTIIHNLTTLTIGMREEYSGTWSDYAKGLYFNFNAPVDGVGTGQWQGVYDEDGDITYYHGTFRYTVTNNNGIPEFKLTKATPETDGSYKALAVYVNASYTIESFVVESNTTMTFTTDRYFLNYSDGRTQFTMATQDSRMELNKGTEK